MNITNTVLASLVPKTNSEVNKNEVNRLYLPPTSFKAGNQNVNNSISSLQQMVTTEEDKIFAESIFSDGVELAAPEKKLDKKNIYSIFNNLRELLLRNENDFLGSLQHTLEVFAASHAAYTKEQGKLLDGLAAELQKATDELEAAGGDLKGLDQQGNVFKDKLDSLKAELQRLKDLGVSPNDSEYQGILKQMTDVEDKLLKLGDDIAAAKSKYDALSDKATNALSKFNTEMSRINNATGRFSNLVNLDEMQQRNDEQLKASHRLIFILNESIKNRTEEAVKRAEAERNRTEINTQLMGEKRVKQAEKSERDYEKAQEAAKKSDCISKILGFIVAAVSIVLTVASGGLASPLSAVLIGLTVADMAMTAATGQSFMAKALEPLMKHVLMPVLNAIGQAMDFLFEHSPLGQFLKAALPPDIFQTLRSIFKVVNTIAAIIVAGYVLKNAASFLKNSNIGKSIVNAVMKHAHKMMEAIARNIPQVLKNFSHKAGEMMGKVSAQLTVQNHANALKLATLANQGVGVANLVQNSVSKINLADKNIDVTKAHNELAMVKELREKQDELSAMMQESLNALQEFIAKLNEIVSKIIEDNRISGQKILQNQYSILG